MNYCISLWEDGVWKELHKLSLSYGDEGFYRACTSLSAFKRREGERLYKMHTIHKKWDVVGKRCHVQSEGDYEMPRRLFLEATGEEFNGPVPTFEHATVWDFYKAVGYNYKRKKYE